MESRAPTLRSPRTVRAGASNSLLEIAVDGGNIITPDASAVVPIASDSFDDSLGDLAGSAVSIVDRIVAAAADCQASDIHIEPQESGSRVRFRIDGVLRESGSVSNRRRNEVVARIKILARLDVAEKRRPQDGRSRVVRDGRSIDLRVSTLPTQHGEKVVIRLLDAASSSLDVTQLGMSVRDREAFEQALSAPYGMILVTGPTGSGKTTTLYAGLRKVNTPQLNISTIEDPVEYRIGGINQAQVQPAIGFDFVTALRAFLRQDPDTIMVGEIRDYETAETAVRAALTGHLLLSTLHTNDAASAITRLIDLGVEPFLIASTLRLVIAQRLVRRVCSRCGGPELTPGGCSQCSFTGYRGRIGVYEVMSVSPDLISLIVERSPASELEAVARSNGTKSLRDAALDLVAAGVTTKSEADRETLQ